MWATCLLAVISVVLIAASGYLWMQLQSSKERQQQLNKEKQQLEQQLNQLKGEQSSELTPLEAQKVCNSVPSASMAENIKAALDSKNTAAFSTYVTDPVKYVLAASEYGGDVSPDEAASSLEYTHSATGPWDFSLSAATIAGYDAGFYTDYFDADTYVGKAASGMVVSFDFNCDGKIKQIFVAADEDLL